MKLEQVGSLTPHNHHRLALGATALITVAALTTSLYLRFEGHPFSLLTREVAMTLLLLLITRALTYRWYELFHTRWRYTSPPEAIAISKAHIMSSLPLVLPLPFGVLPILPHSVVLGECLLSILFVFGSRLSIRALSEHLFSSTSPQQAARREVLVIGAGVSGHLFVRTILSQPRLNFVPIGFLDDSPSLSRCKVHQIPVMGPLSLLDSVLRQHPQIAAVIIAIPGLSSLKLEELKEICDAHHIPLKQLQSYEEIACSDPFEPKTKLTVEEVLDRDIRVTYDPLIFAEIHDKTVLITGAGGSIGSELVRQVLSCSPARLILLDKSEYNLYAIDQEIKRVAPEVEKMMVLGTVVDAKRLDKTFALYQPDIVFHAAAYKHVPLLETNCYEAFINNIIGTRNLVRCSKRWGAERFILISSDKAVDPSSVMGATKRIKELMIKEANERYHGKGQRSPHLHTAVVRFGNVINSSGSVIPLFKQQILSGQPLTVTHPDMDRYFMSIREAVQLVLTAGILGHDGEIFLLDMGKPLKIVEVAKRLRALYGRRDLPIVFTGLREGEKLSEVLYSTVETRQPTEFGKVFSVHSDYHTSQNVYDWVEYISEKIDDMSDEEIGVAIHQFVTDVNSELSRPRIQYLPAIWDERLQMVH